MALDIDAIGVAYAEAILAARAWIAGGTEADDLRSREFVLHTFSLGTELWVLKADPADPHFTEWEHPWRKFGGDNPWTIYSSAPLDPANTYRITGDTGDSLYLGFQLYACQGGLNIPTGNTNGDQLQLGSGGRFELVLSAERPVEAENWLQLAPEDELLIVRQYRHRGTDRPGQLNIERLGPFTGQQPPFNQRLTRAAMWSRAGVLGTMEITDLMRASAVNRFPPPGAAVRAPRYGNALYPTKDNVYDGCLLRLNEGEGLRLRGRLPAARYVSFVFYDVWFTTPDYRRVRSYLSDADLRVDREGRYDIVFAPREPRIEGVDWIDTCGLREGIVAIRSLLPMERCLPEIEIVELG